MVRPQTGPEGSGGQAFEHVKQYYDLQSCDLLLLSTSHTSILRFDASYVYCSECKPQTKEKLSRVNPRPSV